MMAEIISLAPELSDEEAAAQILAWRCRKALGGAADLALHVRSLAINGVTERGETLPEWSSPMRITATDDVDSMFAQLVNWVGFWSDTLDVDPPSTAVVAWSNFKEVQGFKAGTTPEGAHLLVSLQAMWLNLRAESIDSHESAEVYRRDIVHLLGVLRGTYPLAPRPPKPISLRPCPLCGEFAVGAEWCPPDPEDFTGLSAQQVEQLSTQRAMLSVEVRCERCGNTIGTTPDLLAKWLA